MSDTAQKLPAADGGRETVPEPEPILRGRSQVETAERLPRALSRGPQGDAAGADVSDGSRRGGEGPGTVIGRYRLIDQIGAGGFGAVFLAEQREPVTRKVALKILKLGMDSQQVIARFEQERQALALMDHPHIAKVLDAGTTNSGRPYFVMELVTGQPITSFCDAEELSVRERLRVFTQVCDAIQHAHQKGVVHRDIKPSNVLVSLQDGRPRAHVIDFGIAKALQGAITDQSMHTRLGQFVGTPLYMSPEQSEGSADIDTRTDVYSLGVLLYVLLTGTTPFDAATFDHSSVSEMHRVIREVDPPRPSSRVSSSTDSKPLAAQRKTDPAKLASLLRGELDWITMKALEKERQRRYDSASALAQDVERFLAGEPVVAAPPSTTYRVRKFVARHRAPVVAAAIVALALVGGLAGTLWQARVAALERDTARQEAARATALNDFMTQMLTASDPEVLGSRDVTVQELLSKASETATRTLGGEPEAEAEARTLLGRTFRSLGKPDEAIIELERAIALRKDGAATSTIPHARSLAGLASALHDRGDFQSAMPLHDEAIRIVEALGDAHLEELAVLHHARALTLSALSRYEEAEQALDRSDAALDRLTSDLPGKRGSILTSRATLANDWKGDLDEAEALYTEALRLYRLSGEPWLVVEGLNSLAVIKTIREKLDEAIPLHEESIAAARQLYGNEHPQVATRLENYGNVYMRRREFDRTIALLEEALAIREAVYGADSFPAARTRFNMGAVANQSGDDRRALALFDATLPVFRTHAGERSQEVAIALLYRGRCHESLGSLASALRDYESALAIFEELGAPELRLNTLVNLSRFHCKAGSPERAYSTQELALRGLEAGSESHARWSSAFERELATCKRP